MKRKPKTVSGSVHDGDKGNLITCLFQMSTVKPKIYSGKVTVSIEVITPKIRKSKLHLHRLFEFVNDSFLV